MDQPEGFVVKGQEKMVCKLVKSLYGLKQAPKQWHDKFDRTLTSVGFVTNEADKCVYYRYGGCRMDLPGPTISVGTRTDYSVGPWDYSACATWHLMAWGARTTVEKYSERKQYMSCTM
jgi:hypothetical protein